MKRKFELPSAVEFIINKINSAGHRADVVGGPVRDFLLGERPHDYDITTSARPEEIKAIFADFRTVDTGIKHGTVTLVMDGENYEITTYRIDGEYKDSRHPESVEFTKNLAEDLARRDFTMNAIAYNPTDGIEDRFNGEKDIAQKIIRAVGEPKKRFTEDALRILRGIRFSAVLGFEIEEQTAQAMRECKELLSGISAERIFVEWKKLLSGDHSYEVIEKHRDIIEVFLPEISGVDLPEREAFYSAEPIIRQICLFAPLGDGAKKYREAMIRLKTDAATRDVGALVLSARGEYDLRCASSVKIMMNELGADVARASLKLKCALGKISIGESEAVDNILAAKEPYRISDLDINGADALFMGFKGSLVGAALKELILAVINGEIKNERASLLRALAEIKKKYGIKDETPKKRI